MICGQRPGRPFRETRALAVPREGSKQSFELIIRHVAKGHGQIPAISDLPFPFAALPALGALLRRQRERTDSLERAQARIIPRVFHRGGAPIRDIRAAWKTATEAAGLGGRIPHDFRRTAVRNLERAGVPRSVAMKLTGHKTESVYRRYAIVSEADLSAGVAKLAALHEGEAGAARAVVPLADSSGKARAKQAPQRAHMS